MVVVNARFLTQKITGVQRFASELSIKLKSMLGKDVIFLAPHNIIETELAKELEVRVIGKHTGYYWEQIELPKYLRSIGSPLLLSLCNVAPLMYANNIVAIHDIIWKKYPKTSSWKFRLVYSYMIPHLCKSARHIITVSEFSKNEISKAFNIPEKKFTVIYNAVDDRFNRNKDESLKHENYFLAVSTVKANKNFQAAVRAFNEFNKTHKECKLYIIGDTGHKNYKRIDLGTLALNENFKLLGRVSDKDLIRYYSNAIAFLFPSLYEGFGIPPLEAQACQCPVISSNASSLPEVLGDSALFFDPNDIHAFAMQMEIVYTDLNLRTQLIEKGLKNVSRFSWKESAARVKTIVDEYSD